MSAPLWTLDRALTLARMLERLAAASGWHVALAGGVLIRGMSSHDLDLVFYPRSTATVDLDALRLVLVGAGLTQIHTREQVQADWRKRGSSDEKHVEVWQFDGRRVDVIIPRSESAPAAAPDPSVQLFTPKERAALVLLAAGLSNKLIADRMKTSYHTAKFHVANIMKKLRAENRAHAVAIAASMGFVGRRDGLWSVG